MRAFPRLKSCNVSNTLKEMLLLLLFQKKGGDDRMPRRSRGVTSVFKMFLIILIKNRA